jgi:hypothetical protein
MVEKGYVALSPYVRIRDPRLRDFIRHDLSEEERSKIFDLLRVSDDRWERMKLPIFVLLGALFIFVVYTSQNAVQLMSSAFLALTALLPFARDPVGQILSTNTKSP